jgi:hypothetical protein
MNYTPDRNGHSSYSSICANVVIFSKLNTSSITRRFLNKNRAPSCKHHPYLIRLELFAHQKNTAAHQIRD